MKTKNTVRSIILVVALSAAVSCDPVTAGPLHWVYEGVAPEKTTGALVTALDPQDFAHLVYGRDALYYDWQDANGWHSEVVDATAAPGSIGMVLDSSARPHVVYVDLLTGYLKYASRGESGWTIETIAQDAYSDTLNFNYAVIALNSAGWPHVGYRAGTYQATAMKHLSKDTSGWHGSTAGTWSKVPVRDFAIGVADDGQPHLACTILQYSVGLTVYHAWRDGSGWLSAQHFMAGQGSGKKLRFDSAGRLHGAYYFDTSSEDQIQYLLGTKGTFLIEKVTGIPAGAIDCALEVTPAGVPHVAFGITYSSPGLQYWSRVGGVWQKTLVDTNGTSSPLLALDAVYRPHLLYRTQVGTNWFIKSAWQDAQGWHKQLEPFTPALPWNKLMISSAGQLYVDVSYYSAGTLFYSQVSGGWYERLLAPREISGSSCRMVMDAHGRSHLAYSLAYETASGLDGGEIKYAWRDESGWHKTDVPSTWSAISCLALDTNGRPHIAYKTTNSWFGHAVLGNAGWETSLLVTNSIFEAAVAVDAAEQPHLIARKYDYATNTPLYYLWRDGGGWHQETVTVAGPCGQDNWVYPALAMDSEGRPHISFYDRGLSGALKYGYRSEAGWQITTVDANGGTYCTLALNGQNQPQIAYVGPYSSDIKYARKDAGGWQIATAGTGFSIRYSASLWLSPDRLPQIVYQSYNATTAVSSLRYGRFVTNSWEDVELIRFGGASMISSAVDQQERPHIAFFSSDGRENLSYLHVPSFSFKGLTLLPGNQVRLNWQGALEGVGVDSAPSPSGPWSPVAENLSGLERVVDASPPMGFFRLRQGP